MALLSGAACTAGRMFAPLASRSAAILRQRLEGILIVDDKLSIKEVGQLAREIDADAFRMPMDKRHARYRETIERRERALEAARHRLSVREPR